VEAVGDDERVERGGCEKQTEAGGETADASKGQEGKRRWTPCAPAAEAQEPAPTSRPGEAHTPGPRDKSDDDDDDDDFAVDARRQGTKAVGRDRQAAKAGRKARAPEPKTSGTGALGVAGQPRQGGQKRARLAAADAPKASGTTSGTAPSRAALAALATPAQVQAESRGSCRGSSAAAAGSGGSGGSCAPPGFQVGLTVLAKYKGTHSWYECVLVAQDEAGKWVVEVSRTSSVSCASCAPPARPDSRLGLDSHVSGLHAPQRLSRPPDGVRRAVVRRR